MVPAPPVVIEIAPLSRVTAPLKFMLPVVLMPTPTAMFVAPVIARLARGAMPTSPSRSTVTPSSTNASPPVMVSAKSRAAPEVTETPPAPSPRVTALLNVMSPVVSTTTPSSVT